MIHHPSSTIPAGSHRRTGKVARLPSRLRHRINCMLRDGLPYTVIIRKLGRPAKSLIPKNLSEWNNGGYRDWLEHQQRLDVFAAKLDLACDFVRKNPHTNIHEASLQIAVSQIFDLLTRLDSASFETILQADPQFFIRLLNTLPRLTRGGIQCLRQRLRTADHKAKSRNRRSSAKGGITSETRHLIEDQFHLFSDPEPDAEPNSN